MEKKVQTTIRLPADLMNYLESRIADRTFANISHALEVCVLRYKEAEENKKE